MMLGQKFVSVIKINGKPILPPVMTKARIAEMRHYRNLAINLEQDRTAKSPQLDNTIIPFEPSASPPAVTSLELLAEKIPEDNQNVTKNSDNENDISLSLKELRIDNSDTFSDIEGFSPSPPLDTKSSLWFSFCDTDNEEIISIPDAIIFDGIGETEPDILNSNESPRTESALRTPLTEIESSPSLASTELSKYMDISPEFTPEQVERTESSSTCSTVKETELRPESDILIKTVSCDDFMMENNEQTTGKKHVRRASYTLECPSPALTAQVDSFKERGMTFPDDMCSIRRTSLNGVPADPERDFTKKTNLNRYLAEVARFPLDRDREQQASPLLLPKIEELLLQHDNYFNQLRAQLILQYKDQMAQLLLQQQEEEEVISEQIQFGDEHTTTTPEIISQRVNDTQMEAKFNRLSAAVKGYLTRRLLRTERVQEIIKTIRDTLEFALNFNDETPIKMGRVTAGEATLHKRILQQLTSSCHDFHDVFFKLSIPEKMEIISQDRALLNVKTNGGKKGDNLLKRNLSTATLKVLERKKVKLQNDFSNNVLSVRDKNFRSKSALSSRSKKSKVKSDTRRVSSGKAMGSPRTSSPRFQVRLGSRSSLSSDRVRHHSARRNLSNVYTQDGSHTLRS